MFNSTDPIFVWWEKGNESKVLGRLSVVLLTGLLCMSCATSSPVVPETLEEHIDHSIPFSKILENPETYRQTLVLLGGEVLSAKRLTEATRLEVLQLPLVNGEQPTTRLTMSEGRFIAMEQGFLDPAQLPPQTRVTIVGEITGVTKDKVGEMEYRFPVVRVKHLHIWEETELQPTPHAGPSIGIFGGGGSGGRVGGGVGIGIGF